MFNRSLPVLLAGLLALLVLTFFCVRSTAPVVEEDLTKRSDDALRFSGHEGVSVKADGQTITLTGTVPSEAARKHATEQVTEQWGVATVVDQLEVVAAAKEPEPAVVVTNESSAPAVTINPYNFTMDYNGTYVVLTGFMPSEDARTDLLTQLDAKFGPQNVIDQLMIGQGEPEDFVTTINTALLPKLKDFTAVVMNISNQELSIQGKVDSNETGEAVTRDIVNSINPAYEANINLSLDEKAVKAANDSRKAAELVTCQGQFNTLLKQSKIQFNSSSATISKESHKLLDQLAAIGKQCAGFSITVAGHTDSTGPAASNLKLSKQRAEAVMEYLKSKSLKAEQLKAVGLGETKPVASNSTRQGRGENRRIEFIVQE